MFGTKKKILLFSCREERGKGESFQASPPTPPSATYDGVLTNSCVLVISQQASKDINS